MNVVNGEKLFITNAVPGRTIGLVCIIDGKPDNGGVPTRTMILADHDSYGFSPCGGIYRPFHELGARVEAGQPAAAIYAIEDPSRPPTILHYKRSGMLWATRGQGRVQAGDSAAVVITEWEAT